MTFTRDPLSVRFDPQAAMAVGLAIQQYQRTLLRRVVSHVTLHVQAAPGLTGMAEHAQRERFGANLSRTERAFTRALYHDARVHQLSSRSKPDARWSLRLVWKPVPVLPGSPRFVDIQVFPDTEGARWSDAHPENSWVLHPELRNV